MADLDWRNEDDYSYTEWLDLRGWAWELLRRNGDYRAKWARYAREGWAPFSPMTTRLQHYQARE